MNIEHQYLSIMSSILHTGEKRSDRTGEGTLVKFGVQLRHNLSDGFPLLTTKKVLWKPVLGELLWFVEGSGDERRLAEITYGTRSPERTTIWTKNANAPYWAPHKTFEGDLGRVYGVQWRSWLSTRISEAQRIVNSEDGTCTLFDARVDVKPIDQLQNIIDTIRTNPTDRRMVLTAFNVGELDQMALPPCHMFAQFDVTNSGKLNCQMYMRSADMFLGVPFNIASYATLTHMIAKVTNLEPGELILTIGNAHIYLNHQDQVREQLSRGTRPLPKLNILKNATSIDDFMMHDFELVGYNPHPAISAPMAV